MRNIVCPLRCRDVSTQRTLEITSVVAVPQQPVLRLRQLAPHKQI